MGRLRSACALAVACSATASLPVGGRAFAGGGPGAGVAASELSADELAAVRRLLRRLEAAMTEGDARAVDGLLSPTLSAEERGRTMSRVKGELERFKYLRFRFVVDENLPVDRPLLFEAGPEMRGELDAGRLPDRLRREFRERGVPLSERAAVARERDGGLWRIGDAGAGREFLAEATPEAVKVYDACELEILVPADYEYEQRTEGRAHMAGAESNSYGFRLARSGGDPPDGGEWLIVRSELFDQFAAWPVEKALGFIFLGCFLVVLAVFLWGWMVLDAWMRTGRTRYALLVLISLPPGALLYFFAVYLRRRFLPTHEGDSRREGML